MNFNLKERAGGTLDKFKWNYSNLDAFSKEASFISRKTKDKPEGSLALSVQFYLPNNLAQIEVGANRFNFQAADTNSGDPAFSFASLRDI